MRKTLITLMAAAAMASPVVAAQSASAETGPQHQATELAKDYLRAMAFSRLGLIGQLRYEGFAPATAAYGVDHSGARWLVQSTRMGNEYLRSGHFSCSGLISQLKYEKFTPMQATYGAHHTRAC